MSNGPFRGDSKRAAKFAELGADILFVEAPRVEAEMRESAASVAGTKNGRISLEGGETAGDLSQRGPAGHRYAHCRLIR